MPHSLPKRMFDVAGAGVGLLVLLPVGLVIGLLIKLSDGGPVFYTQRRVGQFGRLFRIWKFRTMIVNADRKGLAITKEGDPRITPIGQILRRTKLDELPQLWNVLRGEMSFVGPRPEVPRYVAQYTPEQREILNCKPGITDTATVLFRHEAALLRGSGDVEEFYLRFCLPKKIELNRHYAAQSCFARDVWILAQTLCPDWLGGLTVYGFALGISLWIAFQLRFDFQVSVPLYAKFWLSLPGMVLPQMILLMWRRQLRGLFGYFSVPEMKQTAIALTLALVLELALWACSGGRLAPGGSVLLIHFLVSFLALCSLRMFFRFTRERRARGEAPAELPLRRVAIIGTGELAIRLALDLATGIDRIKVMAFFDDDPRMWHKRPHDIPVLGMPECLLNTEWRENIDEVIVALPETDRVRMLEIREMLRGLKLRVRSVSPWPLLRPLEV